MHDDHDDARQRHRRSGLHPDGPRGLPDRACTPGAVQSTNTRAVCTSGWASEHRHVTSATRTEVYRRYGLTGSHPFPEWEVDHRIPLELGGSNALKNLWPEHHPRAKDHLENELHERVCAGNMTLARAHRIFKRDWRRYD
jgi:hypothetical protein